MERLDRPCDSHIWHGRHANSIRGGSSSSFASIVVPMEGADLRGAEVAAFLGLHLRKVPPVLQQMRREARRSL